MATVSAQNVPTGSLDVSMVDTMTTTATLEHPDRGAMYNRDTLAAAVPVWFHPLGERGYIAILSRRWTNATVGARGPQSYTTYEVDPVPSWVVINPAARSTDLVSEIPSGLTGHRVVLAAASRNDYLFTVGSCDGRPHVAYYRITRDGSVVLHSEEIIPADIELVGAFLDTQMLICLARNADGNLVQVARSWYRIGSRDASDPWKYWGAKGWYSDPEEAIEIRDQTGDPIAVASSASMVRFRNRSVLAVSQFDGDAVVGRFYQSRIGWDWKRYPTTVPLGPVATHLGGAVRFQPQLPVDRAQMANPSGQSFAYVTSVYEADDGEESIRTRWGLYEV